MLSEDQIAFIEKHMQANPVTLLLKYGKEKAFLIAQIESRQKSRLKNPKWYANPKLIFPAAVSVEQSSSEITATYKASLIDGGHLIDATGGMGIDSYFFSQKCKSVVYIEQNETLVSYARHNFDVLKAENITCVHDNCLDFLQQYKNQADWLYIDPARRATDSSRVVGLGDCEPNVIAHIDLLLKSAKRVLLKASPLLDIKQTLIDLPVAVVHIVAIDNECKELLFELSQTASHTSNCLVKTIDFKNDGSQQIFDFEWKNEANCVVVFNNPQRYVYEPNVAIMKAGAFKTIANAFQLSKIALHSHLYTSEYLIDNFPGRVFEVEAVVKTDEKAVVPYLPDKKANLTTRNFPITTEALRKKLKLKDGGSVYLLATTLVNGDKRVLVCRKVTNFDVS